MTAPVPLPDGDGYASLLAELKERIAQGELPPLWVIGHEGGAELVNYRVRGRYMIVDRLFAAAELRLGGEHQKMVRIVRTDGAERSGPLSWLRMSHGAERTKTAASAAPGPAS